MRLIDDRRLTPARRQEVLKRDFETCMYCFETAEEVDHIIPWSYRHDDSLENLVAACWLCNHIASNKLFDTFEEKKKHILRRREKIFKNTIIAIWTKEELAEMGPALRKDIQANQIITDDHANALRLAKRFAAVGFEVRLGELGYNWRGQ